MRRRHALRQVIATALGVALVACGRSRSTSFQGNDVSGSGFEPTFELPDVDGRVRRLSDFHGMAVLVFFGFVRCPSVCPTSLARAARVRELLGKDAQRLQVVFVSVDPAQDTAAVLGEYLRTFDASFVGLRGSEEQTLATAKGFKVFYQRVPLESGGYTMDHTALSYLFDPQGRLRVLVGHDLTAEQVASDVRALLAEDPKA